MQHAATSLGYNAAAWRWPGLAWLHSIAVGAADPPTPDEPENRPVIDVEAVRVDVAADRDSGRNRHGAHRDLAALASELQSAPPRPLTYQRAPRRRAPHVTYTRPGSGRLVDVIA